MTPRPRAAGTATFYLPWEKEMERTIKIVVLDRGFVFVGYVMQSDAEMTIDHARCIRRWGTTQGLGELARGPRPGTQLDAICHVQPQLRAVMFTIDCDQQAWEPHLN